MTADTRTALAAAVAALPRTAESHPFIEWDGKGCRECGKTRNGSAHTAFHKATRTAQRTILDAR